MRVLFAVTVLSFALMGCNGGEDFSGATVAGCPAGAPCEQSVRGEVFIELSGPKINNVGYKCAGTEVVFYTSDTEVTTTDTDGQPKVIPPFTALCPASSSEIEFFLGNGLFEGSKITLGSYRFPQQLRKESFQVTVPDLILPPSRVNLDKSVLFRSALLQALDNDGDATDEVLIQNRTSEEINQGVGVDVNQVIDDNDGLIPSQAFDGYADYADFVTAWQPMINAINDALSAASKPAVAGFDADTTDYEARVSFATGRTKAGLYSFESAGECLFVDECNFTSEDGSRFALGMSGLILPSGKVLAGGQLIRSTESDTELDFVGLESTATLSDTLALINDDTQDLNVPVIGAGIGATTPGVTDALMQGRILGQTLYTGVEIAANSDFVLDYPNAPYAILEADKGELAGTLLGRQVPRPDDADPDTIESPMPVRGTKTGSVAVTLDSASLADAVGDYRISLMRPCVGEADDGAECTSIPNPMLEIGSNYPDSIQRGDTTVDIATERPREDENNVLDFCLTINPGGLITTGGGSSCGTTYEVGMVTRTLPDSNSVNVFLRLAPGLDVRAQTPHYNVEIQGRIDLDVTCSPMYRLSDANFEDQIRAGWVDLQFLPAIQQAGWSSQDTPSDEELLVFSSLQSGAVEFAEEGCTP